MGSSQSGKGVGPGNSLSGAAPGGGWRNAAAARGPSPPVSKSGAITGEPQYQIRRAFTMQSPPMSCGGARPSAIFYSEPIRESAALAEPAVGTGRAPQLRSLQKRLQHQRQHGLVDVDPEAGVEPV